MTDADGISKLKNRIVQNFINGGDSITSQNRANMERMVNNTKDVQLRKVLSRQLKAQKSKAALSHHKAQVEYFCSGSDENRWQTAWFYINENV